MRDIARDEWITEVTEGSSTCWVVVHLYQDSVEDCNLLNEFLCSLAQKFRDIKFLRIKSHLAVENWPDRNLPALFLYNGGELKHQLVTLRPLRGRTVDGMFSTFVLSFFFNFQLLSDLEIWLAEKDVVLTDIDLEAYEESRSSGITIHRANHDDEDD